MIQPLSYIRDVSSLRIIWIVFCVLLCVTCFFPAYVPVGYTRAFNTFTIAKFLPGSLSVPLLFLGALLTSTLNTKRARWISVLLATAGILAAVGINGFTDTNAPIPEPYNGTIISIYFLGLPLFALLLAIRRAQRKANSNSSKLATQEAKRRQEAAAKKGKNEYGIKQAALEQLPNTRIDYIRGAVFAISGPIIGVAIWLGLWEIGFIASLAAYVMARITISFYQHGAGTRLIDKRSMYIILTYIGLGVILSFLASFTNDNVRYLLTHQLRGQRVDMYRLLTSGPFWSWNMQDLLTVVTLKAYLTSIITGVAMSALGVYTIVRDVLLSSSRAVEQAKTELAANGDV